MSQAKSGRSEYWRERVSVTYRLHPDLKTSNVMIVWHHPVFNNFTETIVRNSVRDLDLHTSKVDLVFNETIGYMEIFIVSHGYSSFTWDENKYLYQGISLWLQLVVWSFLSFQ